MKLTLISVIFLFAANAFAIEGSLTVKILPQSLTTSTSPILFNDEIAHHLTITDDIEDKNPEITLKCHPESNAVAVSVRSLGYRPSIGLERYAVSCPDLLKEIENQIKAGAQSFTINFGPNERPIYAH